MSAPLVGIDASRAVSAVPTGTEGYSYHLIRALLPELAGLRARLYFREPPPEGAFPGAELRLIPFPRLWTHVRLSWELLREPPDLLFVPAHVLPLVRPRRTLVTIHDLGYCYFPAAHPLRQRLYLELGTRWNAAAATHILADSQATRDALCHEYRTPAEKITIVYPGYESDLAPVRDPVQQAAVRARYGLPPNYVLFLGRIQPRKNLARLVAAFGQLIGDFPALHLALVGPSGWMEAPLREQVRAAGLEARVHFPGYVAQADKAALLSGARVFAFPSLYEGFGFPVLEAQACGVPVLTSNTSSLPEAAGDGALLVNPLDTEAIAAGLRQVLTDAALRRELVARGETNLHRFAWERAAQQVAAVMRRLLEG